MTKPLLAILLLLPLSVGAEGAEIFCISGGRVETQENASEIADVVQPGDCLIAKFAGEIVPADQAKVDNFLRDNPRLFYLELDSTGGDLEAALQIGRKVRAINLYTMIPNEDDVCLSACFFIWLGGVYRTGDPGIHRPYAPNAGLAGNNIKQAQAYYSEARRRIQAYIEEIDTYGQLPATFIATMFETPPKRVRFLSTIYGVSPNITATYAPHIEQLVLDTCGSMKNMACLRSVMLSNR